MGKTLLFIHGIGGGSDSYEANYLREFLESYGIRTIIKSYEFDPEKARAITAIWNEEFKPDLIIGESIGACYAMLLGGAPHLFISPALNGPPALYAHRKLCRINCLRKMYERWLDPKEPPVRQRIDCSPETMSHFKNLKRDALESFREHSPSEKPFAFFGKRDILLYFGFVSIFTWNRLFGKSAHILTGCGHVMNKEEVRRYLVPKVLEILE